MLRSKSGNTLEQGRSAEMILNTKRSSRLTDDACMAATVGNAEWLRESLDRHGTSKRSQEAARKFDRNVSCVTHIVSIIFIFLNTQKLHKL